MQNTNSFCQINWAPENGRARKIISRSNHRVTGKYPSWKTGRMMHWESMLERDAFYLLDADPSVVTFSEQPVQIVYVLDGVEHVHFPDIFVSYVQQSFLFEIKPDKKSLAEDLLARTKHLSPLLEANQLQYRILTESEIRKEPRLSNSKLLLRHGRNVTTQHEQQRIIEHYFTNTSNLPGMAFFGEASKADFPILCRMILEGTIRIDINVQINTHSKLYLQPTSSEVQAWL